MGAKAYPDISRGRAPGTWRTSEVRSSGRFKHVVVRPTHMLFVGAAFMGIGYRIDGNFRVKRMKGRPGTGDFAFEFLEGTELLGIKVLLLLWVSLAPWKKADLGETVLIERFS